MGGEIVALAMTQQHRYPRISVLRDVFWRKYEINHEL